MRLVGIDNIREGMTLGKTLYNLSGQVLLRKGVRLNESLIISINKLTLDAIYIDDEFSKEVEVKDVVDGDIRQFAVTKVKSFFTQTINNPDSPAFKSGFAEIKEIVETMVDQIISNRSMMVNLMDLKTHDDYTFQHSVNVSILSAVMAVAHNFNRRTINRIAIAGLYHDIGKMKISKDILNKPGKLTDTEFEEMKKHSSYGYAFAKQHLQLHEESLVGILHHHEKFNGTGYPDQRKGTDIHINAQIVAISDVFDAITSKRTYHEAILPSEAIEYMLANANQHFGHNLVNTFLRKVAAYPLGTIVHLSNGKLGLVVENYEQYNLRPKVKVLTENPEDSYYIELYKPENMSITIMGYSK